MDCKFARVVGGGFISVGGTEIDLENEDQFEVVEKLNHSASRHVAEEVNKALDIERRNTKYLFDDLKKASRSCPSCGMLWPDHGDRCGLWVRHEAVRKAGEGGGKGIRASRNLLRRRTRLV